MNKSDIVRSVYERLDRKVTLKDLDAVLDTMLNLMSEALARGEEIQLTDFGTFSLADKTIKSVLRKASPKTKKK
jgi:nucleoid DNA-binding protein